MDECNIISPWCIWEDLTPWRLFVPYFVVLRKDFEILGYYNSTHSIFFRCRVFGRLQTSPSHIVFSDEPVRPPFLWTPSLSFFLSRHHQPHCFLLIIHPTTPVAYQLKTHYRLPSFLSSVFDFTLILRFWFAHGSLRWKGRRNYWILHRGCSMGQGSAMDGKGKTYERDKGGRPEGM